jgi:ankyrin repeat protein
MYPNEYPADTPETPLWLAAKLGCYDDVISLITSDHGVEGFGGYMHCSPLAIAAVHNHADIVLELVKHGADLLSKDRYHTQTALHATVRQYNARSSNLLERIDIASILIRAMVNRGLTLDSTDECGRTALHLAVADRNISIVRCLIDNGASISARDEAGMTALKYSIIEHNLGITKLLIESGADINERYHHGRMPLHLCVNTRVHELLRFLLANGADVHATDHGGLNAIAIASQQGWLDGVDIIKNESA